MYVPEQQFIDSIYPWFEPRTAPKGLKRLTRLMQDPDIKSQVDIQRIRYLVWLDGSTKTDNQGGSISCAIGPGGGGCFGFAQWEKSSIYEAIVWDLSDFSEKGPTACRLRRNLVSDWRRGTNSAFNAGKKRCLQQPWQTAKKIL